VEEEEEAEGEARDWGRAGGRLRDEDPTMLVDQISDDRDLPLPSVKTEPAIETG
jgi:hypothetical protein